MTSYDVTFRGIQATPKMKSDIKDQIRKLDQLFDRITNCHVVVERVPQSDSYSVRLQLNVPQKQIVVDHTDGSRMLRRAVHDAFRAARRQLVDYRSVIATH